MTVQLWGVKVELARDAIWAYLKTIVSVQMPFWLFVTCVVGLGFFAWWAWKCIQSSRHIDLLLVPTERIRVIEGKAGPYVSAAFNIVNFSAHRDFSLEELTMRLNTVVEGSAKSKVLPRSRISRVVVDSPPINDQQKQWLVAPAQDSRPRLSAVVRGSLGKRKIEVPFDFGEVEISPS